MSAPAASTRAVTSPSVIQLIRNITILPVVRSNFESDNLYFDTHNRYGYPSPYASAARRAIRRIDSDLETLKSSLRAAGVKLGDEERNTLGVTRTFDYGGERRTFALRWGTFEGEIELLMHYYLGNLDAYSAKGRGR